jgi:type IV pilus assembly protein PilW
VDRERFAVDIISRVVSQAGYEDHGAPVPYTRSIAAKLGGDPEPDIFAWNNAVYAAPNAGDLLISQTNNIVDGNRPGACGSVTDTSCRNGSDVLAIRFQGSTAPGTTTADMSMINCRGEGEPSVVAPNLSTRAVNFFYVDRHSTTGEPALHCGYFSRTLNAYRFEPLLEGVEALQVLFGTDNVVANSVPLGTGQDSIADRWLRADQLKVAGDPVATKENFRRVRAVRIGLVLRGPPGSAQERVTATLAPLGTPTFVAAADTGSQLDVAADGRLRRVATFTVHIRNDLSLR